MLSNFPIPSEAKQKVTHTWKSFMNQMDIQEFLIIKKQKTNFSWEGGTIDKEEKKIH